LQEQEQDRLIARTATHQKKCCRCNWEKRGKIKTCRLFKYPDGLLMVTELDLWYGHICKASASDEEKTAVGVLALAGATFSLHLYLWVPPELSTAYTRQQPSYRHL
jgi:hypothetical protein